MVSDKKIKNEHYEKRFIENTTVKLRLHSPRYFTTLESIENRDLLLKDGLIFFSGKFIQTNKNQKILPEQFTPDFIINPNLPVNKTLKLNKSCVFISNKRFNGKDERFSDQIFNVLVQGAYQKKW